MHVHEDYRNQPFHPPTLTSDQKQQIEEDLSLMTQKGVYSYEYMDSFEWFQEPQLPPKDAFYSSLTDEDISEIDYTHPQRVFNHFDMTDLGDYHNIYLLGDMLLLANVFDNFRDVCLQHYGLYPAHNYTFPCLPWQAALKMKDMKLDLFTDTDQHLFIEEGIRGRVVMIGHWYTQAYIPCMKNYDSSKRNSNIMYLDANNLYGWVMSQLLPTSNFKWLRDKEIKT